MNQQAVPAASQEDESEIAELIGRLSESWSRGDAEAYGAEFTDDCDYVAFDGTRFRGPSEPQAHLARLFDTVLKDSRLEGEVESVLFVAPDVAVVHWTGSVAYPWQRRVRRRRLSRQTLVLVRERATVARNRIPEFAGTAAAAGRRRVSAGVAVHPLASGTGGACHTLIGSRF